MKIILLISTLFLLTANSASGQFDKLKKAARTLTSGTDNFNSEEIGEALKEALTKGISKGSDLASQVDGYLQNSEIKLPFPPEAKNAEVKLRQLGLGNDVDKFIVTLNRAAEDAAKEAKPIFVSAIKQMTIQDAAGILKGEQDAATQYLNRTTSPSLKDKFKPVIKNSLEKVNATKYYSDLINTYNKIPLVRKMNPNLDDYATNKAIEGLFIMIAKEEKNIRNNPGARTTELLKRVFGSQSK
ncbi:MAG: DUF4197 domain-containing protein [Cyclobacteriaceae bacterium]